MEYISYKESKLTEQERKQNNEKYIETEKQNQKHYFENMFKNIDENIKLDEEQIKIILTDEDNQLVIAGAGSGKTTTITAKVNYLIEKKNIKDEEILIISFTNKAVNELKNMDYKNMIIGCLSDNPSNEFYKHMGGKLVDQNPLVLPNGQELLENLYYYDI